MLSNHEMLKYFQLYENFGKAIQRAKMPSARHHSQDQALELNQKSGFGGCLARKLHQGSKALVF